MKARLADLARLAALLREAELGRLARAAAARDQVLRDLAAHDGAAHGDGIDDPRALARHGEWRAVHRARLNAALARETVPWLEARDAAARAVGRADVLEKLAAAPRPRR